MAYDNNDGRIRGRKRVERRRRVWARNPFCAHCGKLVVLDYPHIDAFELDHIVALDNGGQDTEANCQVLCVSFDEQGNKAGCHMTKTDKDMGHQERAEFDASGRVVW